MIRPSMQRPSAVLRRDLRRRPTVAVAGEGAYILDEAGKRYLDAIGGAAVSEQAGRRELYAPILLETSQIAPSHAYRDQRHDETSEACGLRVADELEAEIQRLRPETVAGFVVEPVGGATCYPSSSSADGVRGVHVLLAPPFIVSEAQVEEIVAKPGQALAACLPDGRA